MFYRRLNRQVFFILPTIAVGQDVDGLYFIEFGWGPFVFGLGTAPS